MALAQERVCSKCGEVKNSHSEETEGGTSTGWFCNTPQCLIHKILKNQMRHALFVNAHLLRLEAMRPMLVQIIQEANPGSTDET
jgi:hypothetical protein